MSYPLARPGVNVYPPARNVEAAGGNGVVTPCIIALEACGFMEMAVPETVITGEPGFGVWPSKPKTLAELSVIVLEPRVRRLLGVGIGNVLLPMMRLEPPTCSAIGVPDISNEELGKIVEPERTITGNVVGP